MKKIKISLIIPTVNRDSLSVVKESIEGQTLAPDELIVIKDVDRKGASWARNRGIEQSTGDLIAFTDDDCLLERDWLEKLVDALLKFEADVAGGTMIETDPFLNECRIRSEVGFPTSVVKDSGTYVFNTCSILYRRAILEKCKSVYGYFFDEKFAYIEDVELSWRVRMLGGSFVFVPANPKHLRQVNFGSYQKLQFNRGQGLGALHKATKRKNMPLKPLQKSRLWGKSTRGRWQKWTSIFIRNVLGPFDRQYFSSAKYFFCFWVGEKARALGYFMEVFFKK